MRPGWNPTRRNRNIGTNAQGHGENNRLKIPESWHDWKKNYYEKLSAYKIVTRTVNQQIVRFFVEPPRPDAIYPCSIDDICHVLAHCDHASLTAFDFIVLRQPTRKQSILCPVWGRAIFHFDIDAYLGAAIVIEAQDLRPITWPKLITTERARELERLRQDGHDIRHSRRGVQIHVTPTTIRNTVLYRTLLHEIGHHIDYNRSSEEEWEGKTRTQKEDYAHRYAQETFARLSAQQHVPFPPMIDALSLDADGLKKEWFCFSDV